MGDTLEQSGRSGEAGVNWDLGGEPVTTVMTGTFTERVEQFILESLLLGDRAGMPAPTDSLIESGVMDSTGVLELIEFLEQEFEIRVEDAETVLENLDSIQRVVDFVARKRP